MNHLLRFLWPSGLPSVSRVSAAARCGLLAVSMLGSLRALPITPEPARVAEIASWMHAEPDAFTPAFDDRFFWAPLAATSGGKAEIARADTLLNTPIPALTEALYDEFKSNGTRKGFELPYAKRIEMLDTLTLAEGMTNTGRYIPGIEAVMEALLDQPAWTLSAHTAQFTTWADAEDFVELGAVNCSWSLSTAYYLLGHRLPAVLRARIHDEVEKRVLAPCLERVRSGKEDGFWWMKTTNNWNAVCNAGVLCSALIMLDSPEEKARFAAAFESDTRYFLSGYGDDGFCKEGMGYWDYGFGHFLLGAEALRRATGGHLDLLDLPKVKSIAAFGTRYEIARGIYPAFSDVASNAKPSGWITNFTAVHLGVGESTPVETLGRPGQLIYAVCFDLSIPRKHAAVEGADDGLAAHDWFPDAGALFLRNSPADVGLSVVLKGGSNDKPHNHDDIGSFVVVNNGIIAIPQLGGDVYVKDTFGPKRYTSEMLNSFGQPVPLVAGRLQSTGAQAKAVTIKVAFDDAGGVWGQDITSAYDVPALKRLTRTFIYTRANGGRLEILDHAIFTTPQALGTAIILKKDQACQKIGADSYRVGKGRGAVDINVQAEDGSELVLTEKPVRSIVPSNPPKGFRLGFDLAQPASDVTIRTVITPARESADDGAK